MITLYTAPTPNGHKVSIAIEELGLEYRVKAIDLMAGEQKQPEYVALNPNGRIPTIVDHDAGDFVVFESGAILIYLAEKTGKLLPSDTKGRSTVLQWLMFQMAGVGPMMGQANVFYRYFPEKIPAAIARYQNEARRLLTVLDQRLQGREWLADVYSIADLATWPWVRTHNWSGVSLDGLNALRAWSERMADRPACRRGLEIPYKMELPDDKDDAAQQFSEAARTLVQL